MNSIASRYDFPGYAKISMNDTSTHQFEMGTIMAGEHLFTVSLLRAVNFEKGREFPFLVSKIEHGGKVIWDYKSCGHSECYGRLAWANDELVIAFISKGVNGKVVDVTALADILAHRQTSLDRKIKLKRAAADFLNRQVEYSSHEQTVIELLAKRQREEEVAKKEEGHRQRLAEKLKRRAVIMAREKVYTFTLDGQPRSGIPVVGDEWHSLPSGTWVILVESYDDDVGKPIEAFVVDKAPGGKANKGKRVFVRATQGEGRLETVKVIKTVLVEGDGDFYEVQIFRSMNDIKTARAQGLNGGTRVAVESATDQITVLSVTNGGIKTEGVFNVIK